MIQASDKVGDAPGDRRRVLVVEDDESIMNFFRDLLVSQGYEVIQARNGVEAMVVLTSPEATFPHAAVLDIGLPLEDGVSVLHFLRNVLQSKLPVIVVTGRQDSEEERELRNLGIADFIRKPVISARLLEALSSLLH